MNKLLFKLFVVFFLSTKLIAQTQPNTQLIGKWPYGFLYEIKAYDQYLLAASGRMLQIFDYSYPVQPGLVAEVWLNDATTRMEIMEDKVYVVCSDGVFAVIDIASPAEPQMLMQLDFDHYLNDVFVKDQYAYLLFSDGGIRIFDLSDYENPIELVHLFEYQNIRAFEIRNDAVYIGRSHSIEKYDMPDPITFNLVSSYNVDDFVVDVVTESDRLYGLRSHAGLFTMDISDPYSLTLIAESDSMRYSNRLAMEGDIIAVSSAFEGIHLFSKSGTRTPVHIYNYDPGQFNRSVAVSEEFAYHNGANAIYSFDISDQDNISLHNVWHAPGEARFVEYYNDHLYVTGFHNTLSIIDIQDPQNPQLVFLDPSYDFYRSIYIHNDLLFAGDLRGLLCYDVSNPAQPELIDTVLNRGSVQEAQMHGQYLFGYNDFSIFILDLADIENPVLINELEISSINAMLIVDDILYIERYSELIVYDISELSNWENIYTGTYFMSFRDMVAKDGYLYMLGGSGSPWSKIRIMDISDPHGIHMIKEIQLLGELDNLFIKDYYLYVGKQQAGMQIYDLTVPANPELCGYFDEPSAIWDYDLDEHNFFVSFRNTILFATFDQLVGQPGTIFIPKEERLQLVPNPASDYFIVNLPSFQSAYNFQLYDLKGSMVFQGVLNSGKQHVNVDFLPAGFYTIHVIVNNSSTKSALFLKK